MHTRPDLTLRLASRQMTQPKDGPVVELRPTGRCQQAGTACGESLAATSSLAAWSRSALLMLTRTPFSAAAAASSLAGSVAGSNAADTRTCTTSRRAQVYVSPAKRRFRTYKLAMAAFSAASAQEAVRLPVFELGSMICWLRDVACSHATSSNQLDVAMLRGVLRARGLLSSMRTARLAAGLVGL